MTDELTTCIETGTITQEAADKLSHLTPGAYCKHRSWGLGQVAQWRLLTDQIVIDFKSKKGHVMQLQYAAESLEPLPADHILARIAADPASLRKEAQEDPATLMKLLLQGHGGKATVDEIIADLVPDIFSTADFKKWFDSAKKRLKADGHFVVPTKKTAPFELQESSVPIHERLLEEFHQARHPKEQASIIDSLLKFIADFKEDTSFVHQLNRELEQAAKRSGRIHATRAIEFLLARDELTSHLPPAEQKESSFSVSSLLQESSGKLREIFEELPVVKYRRLLALFPESFQERWQTEAQQLLRQAEPRLIGEIFRLFESQQAREVFYNFTLRAISERSISSDFLKWLCQERSDAFPELINPELFLAILSVLERDLHSETRRGGPLQELLFKDRELVGDLFHQSDLETARHAIRKIGSSPVFNDLDRRSLLARILKVHPELETIVMDDASKESSSKREETLTVSWQSLERRKNEYEHLVTKLIPQNTKDISTARSYGDLRENFEFKSAKEQQRVLLRQKAEFEEMFNQARGTNFENPDTTAVSIGTIVTLQDHQSGQQDVYSVLGAWDSAPEKGWISYQTAIGQALLGHSCGESIILPSDQGERSMTIEKIEPFTNFLS
jgi:transcription elongation GreA/GreB family factor